MSFHIGAEEEPMFPSIVFFNIDCVNVLSYGVLFKLICFFIDKSNILTQKELAQVVPFPFGPLCRTDLMHLQG